MIPKPLGVLVCTPAFANEAIDFGSDSINSDCEIEGRCSAEKVCAGRDCHTVNFCKYD
jgi:hypothetical protein